MVFVFSVGSEHIVALRCYYFIIYYLMSLVVWLASVPFATTNNGIFAVDAPLNGSST